MMSQNLIPLTLCSHCTFSALSCLIQTTNGKKKLPRVIDGKNLRQLTPLKSTQSNQQPTMRFVPSKLTGSSSVRVKPKGTPLIN